MVQLKIHSWKFQEVNMRRWQTTLANLVDYPEIHGRFLNTLSLLEYIGARKIMKSQDEEQITPQVLAHMVEELRHAQIIKKLALKVGGPRLKTYSEKNLACGQEGRAYIQAIDSKAQDALKMKDSWANYLLTTLIIEERAQELYPLYDALLAPLGLSGPLKTIVREEVEHLAQVTELLKTQAQCTEEMIESVRKVERQYYQAFFEAIADELTNLNHQSLSLEM
jgi:hypothetical protein